VEHHDGGQGAPLRAAPAWAALPDDKVYSDVLILSRDDGELTTVTMDEYTRLRRL